MSAKRYEDHEIMLRSMDESPLAWRRVAGWLVDPPGFIERLCPAGALIGPAEILVSKSLKLGGQPVPEP